jgi:leader peptidase (prepilin peptidase)/N-methyltransferase
VEIFAIWPAVLFVACGLLGLIVGSFLNVVAYRLPIMMEFAWRRQLAEIETEPFTPPPHARDGRFDLVLPRSACPNCGQPIEGRYNVPILSYLWLKGRCAGCSAPVSPRYPVVEGLAALASVVVAWVFGPSWQTVAALFFTWTLIPLALIDFDTKLLPDSMTLPLMWAGIIVSLIPVDGMPLFADLRSSVIGAVAGYLSLWSVYQVFKLVTGKEGMGYGDFKLLAAICAWLGWQVLPLVILLSAAVGSIVGIGLIVFGGRSRQATIPFGPYLAAAGWIALLWGQELVVWYGQLMR